MRRHWTFFAGFALVALICAGVLSYFADSNPDGLDSATLKGCEVVQTDRGEELTGNCIAQQAGDHHMAGSPLADYAVDGDSRFTGVAGVLGVLATAVVAGGLFWLLRKRPGGKEPGAAGLAGSSGSAGSAGSAGPAGSAGSAGSAGPAGSGPVGSAGPVGAVDSASEESTA
jgi:cobalt/nickel transport protein